MLALPQPTIARLILLTATCLLATIAGAQGFDAPQTDLTPIAPPSTPYAPPAGGYGTFDPYAPPPSGGFGGGLGGGPNLAPGGIPGINSGLGPGVTTIGPPTPITPPGGGLSGGGGLFGGLFSNPAPAPPALTPSWGAPAAGPSWNGPLYPPSSAPYDNPSVYGTPTAPPLGSPFPGSIYPSETPSTLFPGGLLNDGLNGWFGSADPQYSAYQMFRGPRLRHGYVGPGNGSADDLEINDTDAAIVFAFPNFLYSFQPLYVTPSFSLHLWDGPDGSIGADLPANAYSGFIDAGWQSDPNQMFGTEFGVRVGAFTDFDTFNSDSIRVLGKGLVHFRLTPASTLKGGVYYLDRNRVKLLPAFGLLCQPNPYTRFDLFFPQPKFARYFRTIGTKDVWWYLTGEYGGGAWTIERDDNSEDEIDINDLRAIFGLEWGDSVAIRGGRRTGFMEIGYVFDREVIYRRNPGDNFNPDDALLFRLGFGY